MPIEIPTFADAIGVAPIATIVAVLIGFGFWLRHLSADSEIKWLRKLHRRNYDD